MLVYPFVNEELTDYVIENFDPSFSVSYDQAYTTEDGDTATLTVSLNEAPLVSHPHGHVAWTQFTLCVCVSPTCTWLWAYPT